MVQTAATPNSLSKKGTGSEAAGAHPSGAAAFPRRQTPAAQLVVAGGLLVCLAMTGCTALLSPVSGVPAHRLPPDFLAQPKNNLIPIDVSRLRQEPPSAYLIDRGDILGMFIQGVLGEEEASPPFHLPEPGSTLLPSIGYPVPVREDGTISLPFVPPVRVRGLTVGQVEDAVRQAYTVDQKVLQPGKDRIIVTIFKERTYSVIVLRRDGMAVGREGQEQITQGEVVELAAYRNDVMHALAETGGLPGLNAKNEVLILRGRLMDAQRRDQFTRMFYQTRPHDPCLCLPPIPADPAIVRIPLRLPPGETPRFRPTDIILEEGDIVLIEGREREVFYTGGLLGGGEYPLPRDYDLDVLGAMALVGQGVASPAGGNNGSGRGGGGGGGFGGAAMGGVGGFGGSVPPSQLFILRKTPCGDQITIDVDLTRAIRDPRARPLIQPGDMLVLQHRPIEDVVNFAIPTFFTFGIAELISGN